MTAKDRLLVAIDTSDFHQASSLISHLYGHVGGIKLGLEFFNAHGPNGIKRVLEKGKENLENGRIQGENLPPMTLFLDMKYHDIPNTVAQAIKAVMPIGPSILNVHASGGFAMMKAAASAARDAAYNLNQHKPLMLAVTVLTSLVEEDLMNLGQGKTVSEHVCRLALLAKHAGMDGVVCSAHEIETVRDVCGANFTLVTPGIRSPQSANEDQKRVMTASLALKKGADYIVVGRPITSADDPVQAAQMILKDEQA